LRFEICIAHRHGRSHVHDARLRCDITHRQLDRVEPFELLDIAQMVALAMSLALLVVCGNFQVRPVEHH